MEVPGPGGSGHRHLRRIGPGRRAVQALRLYRRERGPYGEGHPYLSIRALEPRGAPRGRRGAHRFQSILRRDSHDHQDRHQRLRPHRAHGVPRRRRQLQGHRSRCHQRPARARLPGLHAEVRLGARPL
ncbi:hypothetical protein CBM2637_A200430 [Cupriavidus taiwanensis]|nr:hypothetical protein CBM2637_A200430 [Cupriavidus taiwanensis]